MSTTARPGNSEVSAPATSKLTLPQFLYIGTSKAGSTWIFRVLSQHPKIYVVPRKGLYFFCNHYHRGIDWYCQHFRSTGDKPIAGEISHTYLAAPQACQRIHQWIPDAKLLVCVREPAQRAFSDYLDGVKNGKYTGTFEEELERDPGLIDRGRYATHLMPYVETFGREAIHVSVFDELGSEPVAFSWKIFEFLEVEPISLTHQIAGKIMPAGVPRFELIARAAKRASHFARAIGMRRVVGRAKKSVAVRNVLYRPYTEHTRPTMRMDTKRRLRDLFQDEVRELDQMLGLGLEALWGYSGGAARSLQDRCEIV